MKNSRRKFLTLAAGSMAVVTSPLVRAAIVSTPSQTAGPFYPDELPLDSDNNLFRIKGRGENARGVSTNVVGRVLDRSGEPVAGARIEIWQCDANGRYHHPDDTNDAALDENFQAYGATVADANGRYRFLTIKPVAYPGRTPHIHFRITVPGGDTLTTQLYIAGHEGNQGDGIYRRLGSDERKQAASTEFVANPDDTAELVARWDVVIG